MNAVRFSADTGGTFTDCLLEREDGSLQRGKVLSSGCLRTHLLAGGTKGTLRVAPFPFAVPGWLAGRPVSIDGHPAGRLKRVDGDSFTVENPPEKPEPGQILEINTGLEAPVLGLYLLMGRPPPSHTRPFSFRLGTTKGTNTLLEKKGAPVALFLTAGFADLMRIRDQKRPHLFDRKIRRPEPVCRHAYGIPGRMDVTGTESEPLDRESLILRASEALAEGCEVAAVCFLNSWVNPAHEEKAREILIECGFAKVCCSSRIRPLIKYLDRADTTVVNATLSPVMDGYLDGVESALAGHPLWVMTSSGGLVSRARFQAVDSLISGPAGGVIGALAAGRRAGLDRIITLDMGGTSTDVSRWDPRVALRQHIRVGNARLLTPSMPVETVAAGGGSVCSFDGERLRVGPESAGAEPGPASYGAGGPLTLTDLHLVLGRIDPEGFAIPICIDHARTALGQVAHEAGVASPHALAEGFLTIATERMAQAIRQVSLREGEDPSAYALVAFGGAGGLHACRVAEVLGMKHVVFPPDAGILSARGIHYAPREAILEKQLLIPARESGPRLREAFNCLGRKGRHQLEEDGVDPRRICPPRLTVFMRLRGQENSLPVDWGEGRDLESSFKKQFVATFGYYPRDPDLEIVKVRLQVAENGESLERESFGDGGPQARARDKTVGFVDGKKIPIPVYFRESLLPGERFPGPAILRDPFGTCFLEAGWEAVCGSGGTVLLRRRGTGEDGTAAGSLERVRKTLILNRLEALVEEMGEQLRRTALSANIRERLDFSCALLDESGELLVNAPHIPVHLGAMGLCVRECLKLHQLSPGDVLITNHPRYGGSHLPDVTLISGLYGADGTLCGYLANRAHHAEWGGKSPGSMPADAGCLEEEGIILQPQFLIRKGAENFAIIEQQLREGPWPSRSPRENRIDLDAQLAALRRGEILFQALLRDYPESLIRTCFAEILERGAKALEEKLLGADIPEGEAEEKLDDGHLLKVRLRAVGKGLKVDFTGTGDRHPGNLNATPAIVRSAVLYVLRLFLDTPMTLNEGILRNVEIELPRSFLNPEFPADSRRCPAVVGGNVETSQRIVDALIRAFGFMAASQGTMNNFLFGNESFGYYETIGGGAGAGNGFDGASGVHVHMTNTAITDPEILEHRFPVQCREFSLRSGSGGSGSFRGGDGLVREIRFLQPVKVSLLTQNRVRGAAGRNGGKDGLPGRQWRIGPGGGCEELPGCVQLELSAGEGIRIETPGGGGWGAPDRPLAKP